MNKFNMGLTLIIIGAILIFLGLFLVLSSKHNNSMVETQPKVVVVEKHIHNSITETTQQNRKNFADEIAGSKKSNETNFI